MKDIDKLLQNNRESASRIKTENPDFFLKLEKQQRPKYLWIGCSDSRVTADRSAVSGDAAA